MSPKTIIIVIMLLFIFAQTGRPQWSTDPTENTIIAYWMSGVNLVSDGHDGVFIFSASRERYFKTHVQRVTINGQILYPGIQGLRVSDAGAQQSTGHGWKGKRFAMADGHGGSFIGIRTFHIVGRDPEMDDLWDVRVYLQRIDSLGNRLFGSDGVWLLPGQKDSTQYYQEILNWCPDGSGGLYVVLEMHGGDLAKEGIYLERVSHEGQILWGPIQISNDYIDEYIPYTDFELNLNLYYYDIGGSNPPTRDRLLKFDKNTGDILFEKIIQIGVGEFGFSGLYEYCQSENGSAIFVFQDLDTDTFRIQKLDSDGNKLWGEEPIVVAPDLYGSILFRVKDDHHGGAYIWYRAYGNMFHLVHYDSQGAVLWDRQFQDVMGWNPFSVAPYGNHVFVLTGKIKYMYKISFEGEIVWQSLVSTRAYNNPTVSITGYTALADAIGGCIVAWDEMGGSNCLRAQRVNRLGHLGGPPATVVTVDQLISLPQSVHFESIAPNPFNETVRIKFVLSYDSFCLLKVFNISGKEVITLTNEKLKSGDHAVHWDGNDELGRPLASGVYVLLLQTDSLMRSQKLILLK